MRWVQVVGVVAVAVALAGCSKVTGTSKSSKASKPAGCAYVTKLDQIASTVAKADVHDPDTFKKTLDAAVKSYVANVRSLKAVAPVELHAGLEQVEADVAQYRFDAALTDRAGLDAYAARSCGRVVIAATPTTNPATATTAALSTASTATTATNVGSGTTTTTAPSDG